MIRSLALPAVLALALAGCGGGGGGASVSFGTTTSGGGSGGGSSGGGSGGTITYVTTSSIGDLGVWSVAAGGVSFSIDRTDTSGAVVATYSGSATCVASGTALVRTCTLTGGTSTDGVNFPLGAIGTTFSLSEAASRSLVVRTGADFDGRAQIHVGLARSATTACTTSLAGSYVWLRMLQGGFDLYGFLATDAAFGTVQRAGFGFTGVNYGLARLAYTSSPQDGTVATSAGACSNGVRLVAYDGLTGRLFTSAVNGLVLDLPAGQGGLVAFDRTQAAGIADLAGRSLRLVEWAPAGTTLATESNVTASALLGTAGSFSVTLTDATSGFSATVEPPDDNALVGLKWATPFAYTTTNAAAGTFGTPASAPGLFQLRRSTGIDNVLLVVARGSDGKLWGLGVAYVPVATGGGTELRAASWFQLIEP